MLDWETNKGNLGAKWPACRGIMEGIWMKGSRIDFQSPISLISKQTSPTSKEFPSKTTCGSFASGIGEKRRTVWTVWSQWTQFQLTHEILSEQTSQWIAKSKNLKLFVNLSTWFSVSRTDQEDRQIGTARNDNKKFKLFKTESVLTKKLHQRLDPKQFTVSKFRLKMIETCLGNF